MNLTLLQLRLLLVFGGRLCIVLVLFFLLFVLGAFFAGTPFLAVLIVTTPILGVAFWCTKRLGRLVALKRLARLGKGGQSWTGKDTPK